MTTAFKIGEKVLVAGLKSPDNLHLNGMETTVLDIISKSEAIERFGFYFAEKGQQNSIFYVLDDFILTTNYTTSFGVRGYKKIDFISSENLRKIFPKPEESFDEMIQKLKQPITECV